MHRTLLIATLILAVLTGCSQPVPIGAPPERGNQSYPDLIPAEQILAQFNDNSDLTEETAIDLQNRGDGLRRRAADSN